VRWLFAAVSLWVAALCTQPAIAAPITYDCQARITRAPVVPPVAPGDNSPWQCFAPTAKRGVTTQWQRDSLEYCRLAVSIYDDALAAARRLARSNRRGSWIVILDADETVLDNSLFERERNACGAEFKDEQWESWVRADLASDVPGAAVFTHAVHTLGGLVAIVTNRANKDDAITQGTLRKAGIWFDYEIGMDPGHSDKTERWRGVKTALAAKFGGRPRTLMWIGDQITDFPVLDRSGRILRAMTQHDDGAGIGERFFILPNPMYGNWQANPAN
jgi:5'-nucleotidase (lipoprotein e(P4) family)